MKRWCARTRVAGALYGVLGVMLAPACRLVQDEPSALQVNISTALSPDPLAGVMSFKLVSYGVLRSSTQMGALKAGVVSFDDLIAEDTRYLALYALGSDAQPLALGVSCDIEGALKTGEVTMNVARLNEFSTLNSELIHGRKGACTAIVNDCDVAVIGGTGDDDAPVLQTERLNGGDLSPSLGPVLDAGIANASCISLSKSRVLVQGDGPTDVVTLVDFANNTVTAAMACPGARYQMTMVKLKGNRVAWVGGVDAAGVGVRDIGLSDFSSEAEECALVGPLIETRISPTAAVAASERLAVAGGFDEDGNVLSTVEMFDISTGIVTGVNGPGGAEDSRLLPLAAGSVLHLYRDALGEALAGVWLVDAVGGPTFEPLLAAPVVWKGSESSLGARRTGIWLTANVDGANTVMAQLAGYRFEARASMQTVRTQQSLELLNHGAIVAVGGYNEKGEVLTTIEMFRPEPSHAFAEPRINGSFDDAQWWQGLSFRNPMAWGLVEGDPAFRNALATIAVSDGMGPVFGEWALIAQPVQPPVALEVDISTLGGDVKPGVLFQYCGADDFGYAQVDVEAGMLRVGRVVAAEQRLAKEQALADDLTLASYQRLVLEITEEGNVRVSFGGTQVELSDTGLCSPSRFGFGASGSAAGALFDNLRVVRQVF